jgi:hypothetical protein
MDNISMVMKKPVLIILFLILLTGHIIHARGNMEKNPDEISEYYQEQINNKAMNQITVLRNFNLNVYNDIIQYIPENESIENYFYISSIVARETGDTILVYEIYYYEILLNKYNGVRGDPTGKCFSIEFNSNNEFIRRYYWK